MSQIILPMGSTLVVLDDLPSGDLTVYHRIYDRVRGIVEPICRGRGRWEPRYRNWIIFAQFKDEVARELITAADAYDA